MQGDLRPHQKCVVSLDWSTFPRQLTRKGVVFQWTKVHKDAFNKLKSQLENFESLAYFDKDAKTKIIADASPVGLGAVLIQEQDGEERAVKLC